MKYKEIIEKFKVIKDEYLKVKAAKETIENRKKELNEAKDTLIKSESNQRDRDFRIKQINEIMEAERKKIEEYNNLITEFFEQHDPNDGRIHISDNVELKIKNDSKEIAYFNSIWEDKNFTYKIENF